MRYVVALALALAGLVAVPAASPAGAGPDDQVVHVTTTEDALVASVSWAVPGVVTFSVSGPGSATLLQLHGDHTLEELYADFAKASDGRTGAIKRLRRNATFFGGMFGGTDDADAMFATELAPGVYQVADLANGNAATFEVLAVAESQRRAPVSAGTVSYTPLGITMPRTMTPGGWMRVVNQGTQVSLMDVVRLRPGTTEKQVRAFFTSQGRKFRGRFTSTFDSTLLLSPDQRYWWSYSLPRGPVAASSSWPREKDGTPQAFHGMWGMTQLSAGS